MPGIATRISIAAAICAGSASVAVSQQPSTGDEANIVASRQAAFHLSAAAFGSMKGALDRGDDVRSLAFSARGLARWARALPTMFPAGSGGEGSNARPEIWSAPSDFTAQAQEYAQSAQMLFRFARDGDRDAFARQWELTRETCQACHSRFRNEPAPNR